MFSPLLDPVKSSCPLVKADMRFAFGCLTLTSENADFAYTENLSEIASPDQHYHWAFLDCLEYTEII